MSTLILQPALWPVLALDPEPFGTASDPESVQRLFSELYGADSGRRSSERDFR